MCEGRTIVREQWGCLSCTGREEDSHGGDLKQKWEGGRSFVGYCNELLHLWKYRGLEDESRDEKAGQRMPVEVSALFEEGTREGVRCTAHDPSPRRRRFLRNPHIKSMLDYSTAPISTRGVASVHSEAAVASDWRKRPQTPSVRYPLPPWLTANSVAPSLLCSQLGPKSTETGTDGVRSEVPR